MDACSNEKTPGLVFITQTGSGKPRDVQTQIRKHVMKDIGKSRRKQGWRGKFPTWEISFDSPELMDSMDSRSLAPGTTETDPNGEYGLDADVLGNGITPVRSQQPDDGNFPSALPMYLVPKKPTTKVQPQPSTMSGVAPTFDRLWTGRMDPFVRYPIEMNQRTLRLIDHVFDDRYGNTPPYRDAWLPVGMMDPAAFHQVLSNAAINIASLRSAGESDTLESLEIVEHHAHAVESISRRISNVSTATTDGFLGAVVGLACYHHVVGDQIGWHMHMKGAQEIIRLRGGIETIQSNRLISMIIFWVDVGGATTEDIPPYFPAPSKFVPERPLPLSSTLPSPQLSQILSTWASAFPYQSSILPLLSDIHHFSTYLSHEVRYTNRPIYRNGGFAASYILPLFHRLLMLSKPDINILDQSEDVLQAVRVSCILFFAEIRRLFGIMGVHSTFQTQKLRSFLLQIPLSAWQNLEILRMWCLAMGGMESTGDERLWFLQELEKRKVKLGLESWGEVLGVLRGVLWYEDVHTVMFCEFCGGVEPVHRSDDYLGGSRFGGHRPLQ